VIGDRNLPRHRRLLRSGLEARPVISPPGAGGGSARARVHGVSAAPPVPRHARDDRQHQHEATHARQPQRRAAGIGAPPQTHELRSFRRQAYAPQVVERFAHAGEPLVRSTPAGACKPAMKPDGTPPSAVRTGNGREPMNSGPPTAVRESPRAVARPFARGGDTPTKKPRSSSSLVCFTQTI
jgi:hypothetical protein